MQTPSLKPLNASSPASATKFVERSLHDLDDLIQQRRLELSALRKSNRKKLTQQFPAQNLTTPIQSRGHNAQMLSSDFKFSTPTLNFDIVEEDLLSYATPVLGGVVKNTDSFVAQLEKRNEEGDKNIDLLNQKIEELSALCFARLDEINNLQSQIANLDASCLEWENNTKVAAQSAFEWEAHSAAITHHYEQQLEEFQAANTILLEENEKLEEMLKNTNASVAINDNSTSPEIQTVNKNNDVDKISILMQIFNQKIASNERKLMLYKAYQSLKMNMYFQSTKELYKRKCAEYLKIKQEEYASCIAKDVRLLFQESCDTVEVIAKPESQTTFLLLLAFFQGLIWLILIVVGQSFISNELNSGIIIN